jgi:hypothetical protein
MEKIVLRLAEISTRQDPYTVLSQVVASVSQDHAQLRMLIYEFARTKLRQDLYPQFQAGDLSGVQENLDALEAAIDRVEANFAHVDAPAPLPFITEPALNEEPLEPLQQSALMLRPDPENSPLIRDYDADVLAPLFSPPTYETERIFWLSTVSERDDRHPIERLNEKLQSNFWWTVQLIVAVVLGVAIFAAIDGRSALPLFGLHRPGQPANVTADNVGSGEQAVSPDGKNLAVPNKVASRPVLPNIPMPSAYGIYAVSNGQLAELDLLPIKVPDQRIAISSPISTPSRAHLPVGQLQFIVFRRDLASDAPDRVAVRVVAQVKRALTFDSTGKPTVTKVDDSWVVRGSSYQMRVAPVPDNPEMILIRPEHAEFVFPAGRYALVLKNVAYDFTLDGPVTDTAHCLERTDALNSPIYTECRNP